MSTRCAARGSVVVRIVFCHVRNSFSKKFDLIDPICKTRVDLLGASAAVPETSLWCAGPQHWLVQLEARIPAAPYKQPGLRPLTQARTRNRILSGLVSLVPAGFFVAVSVSD